MSTLQSSVIVVLVVVRSDEASFVHSSHLLSGVREWMGGLLREHGCRLSEEFFVEFRFQVVIVLARDGAVGHDALDLVVKRGRVAQAGE